MDRDWLDYATFGFTVVSGTGGLVGLFLAVKAYGVAHDSYKVARGQARKSFEIEVLRELDRLLPLDDNSVHEDPQDCSFLERMMSSEIRSGLLHIPPSELPFLAYLNRVEAKLMLVVDQDAAVKELDELLVNRDPHLANDSGRGILKRFRWALVVGLARKEIHAAIKARME